MRPVALFFAVSSLIASSEAGKGHPVGYNYCSAGLTRPKQPKPPNYQPPPKPVGVDFPSGKPAALPKSATEKASPKSILRPPPQIVKPDPVKQPEPVKQPPVKEPVPIEQPPVKQPDPIVLPPVKEPEPVVKPPPAEQPPVEEPKSKDPSQDPSKPKKPKKTKKPKKVKKPKVCDPVTGKHCDNPPPESRSVPDPVTRTRANCTAPIPSPGQNTTHPWIPKHKNDRSKNIPLPGQKEPQPKKPRKCKKKSQNPIHQDPGHEVGMGSGTSDGHDHHKHQVFVAGPPPVQTEPHSGSGMSHPWSDPRPQPVPKGEPVQQPPAKEEPKRLIAPPQPSSKEPSVPRKNEIPKQKTCAPKKPAVQPAPIVPPALTGPRFDNHTRRCNSTRNRTSPMPPPKSSSNPISSPAPDSGLSPGQGSGLSPGHDGLVIPVPGGLSGEATTTQYSDAGGACGCPAGSGVADWQYGMPTKLGTFYTFAGSARLFGSPTPWCGKGCGTCFKITSTGSAPATQGTGAPVGDSIFAVMTNACPITPGTWCMGAGEANPYGAYFHFDILSTKGTFNGVRWDNPRVQFQQIYCPPEVLQQSQTCVCKA